MRINFYLKRPQNHLKSNFYSVGMSEAVALEKENQELRNWIESYKANEKLAQRKIAVS